MSEINTVLFEVHRQAAQDMISALCQPRGSQDHRDWIMSIPAQLNYDPDLVIGQALIDEGKLLREWVKVQAVLTAAEIYATDIDRGILENEYPNRERLCTAVRDLEESEAKDE